MESLLAPLQEPKESVEVRMPILTEDFRACGEQVISGLEAYAKVHDGRQIAPDNHEASGYLWERRRRRMVSPAAQRP